MVYCQSDIIRCVLFNKPPEAVLHPSISCPFLNRV